MARQVRESEALRLYQLIGAPLMALVQAEVQAAQATAEFVERVGFEKPQGADKDANSIGDLRTASFRHQRTGPDGKPQTYNVEIPLLSMVPIPLIQIKNAELDFAVKILETVQTGEAETHLQRATSSETPEAASGDGTASADEDFLSPARMEMKAVLGRGDGGASSEKKTETQIRIKVNVEQADIPAGILKLLNLMDQSVNITPVEPGM